MSFDLRVDIENFEASLRDLLRKGTNLCDRVRDSCDTKVTSHRRRAYLDEFNEWINSVGAKLFRQTKGLDFATHFPIKGDLISMEIDQDHLDFVTAYCDQLEDKIKLVEEYIDSAKSKYAPPPQPETSDPYLALALNRKTTYTEEERQDVFDMLSKFKEVYSTIIAAIEKGAIELPTAVANAGTETLERLNATTVCDAHELTVGRDAFFLDHSVRRKWWFDYAFLYGFHRAREEKRFATDQSLDDAIMLFFLHEIVHPDQGITSRNAINLGRSGYVLELADYDADVFAIEAVFKIRKAGQASFKQKQDKQLYEEIIATALTGLSLFDESEQGGFPLKILPIRRLRRYLIWHFQRSRVAMANGEIPESWLRAKPTLEITFLKEKWDEVRHQTYINLDDFGEHAERQIVTYCSSVLLRGNALRQHNPSGLIRNIARGTQGGDDILQTLAFYLENDWAALRI